MNKPTNSNSKKLSPLRMPIGESDFAKVRTQVSAEGEHYVFVDKSLLIKELLNEPAGVCLLLRPRRFGKTLNLSMLQHFFASEVNGRATQNLFAGLNITRAGEQYMRHQGRYPVIFLSLKDVKFGKLSDSVEAIKLQVIDLYSQYQFLLESPKLHNDQKQLFRRILNRECSELEVIQSIRRLCEYCALHYGEAAWLLIDEYDTPIHTAYEHGYYDELMLFMRSFLGSALKDNSYLHKAILTGILRVSKESLFSDLNNIKVYSSLQAPYGQYFGFTENEVKALLAQAQLTHLFESIKHWYNGYQIGEWVLYNPWSIINCLADGGTLQPYWINTSSNRLIKELIAKSPISVKRDFELLIQGQAIEKQLDENLVFGDLQKDETALWSFLFLAGYLKVVHSEPSYRGCLCQIAIPNGEVNNLFRRMIETWLADSHGIDWYVRFLKDWLSGDMEHFERRLNLLMLQTISQYDVESRNPEKFYHGFLLGLIAALMEDYQIKSNRESGYGRYDIALFPHDKLKLGVVIECKVSPTEDENQLIDLAKSALVQIEERAYLAEFAQAKIHKVLKIGIGFSGKALKIAYA